MQTTTDQTLSKTDSVPGLTPLSGTVTNTYTSLDQLHTSASTRTATGMGYSQTYGVDAGGKLTTLRGSTVAYNDRDEINATGFVYDNAGNPTTYSGTSGLTYDRENHMTACGSLMSATYRADGLRGTKTVGSTTTQYIYDMFGNPVLECHGSTRYAINTFGPNGLISRHIASTPSSFYQFDERGNTVSRSGPTGSILEYHGSETYGLQYSSASTTDPFQGFEAQYGYYYDPETGLSLLGLRYYDASCGRFLNQDPIGMNGGVNLYGYANTNPYTFKDPSGLDSTYNPWHWFLDIPNNITSGLLALSGQVRADPEGHLYVLGGLMSRFNPRGNHITIGDYTFMNPSDEERYLNDPTTRCHEHYHSEQSFWMQSMYLPMTGLSYVVGGLDQLATGDFGPSSNPFGHDHAPMEIAADREAGTTNKSPWMPFVRLMILPLAPLLKDY